MKGSSKRSWACSWGQGLTLIEVVAALAVLGTLLTAILMAEGRCRRQTAGARMRLAACRAVDGLLEQWWASSEKFPRDAEGEIEGQPKLHWKTAVVDNEAVERLGGQVVRLSVFGAEEPWRERSLVTVDVVLPQEKPEGVEGVHAD